MSNWFDPKEEEIEKGLKARPDGHVSDDIDPVFDNDFDENSIPECNGDNYVYNSSTRQYDKYPGCWGDDHVEYCKYNAWLKWKQGGDEDG